MSLNELILGILYPEKKSKDEQIIKARYSQLNTAPIEGFIFEIIYDYPSYDEPAPYFVLGPNDPEDDYSGVEIYTGKGCSTGDLFLIHPNILEIQKSKIYKEVEHLLSNYILYENPSFNSSIKVYVIDEAWKPAVKALLKKYS